MKTFDNYYLYDYVIMTYRKLIGRIDDKMEDRIFFILHSLLDEFTNEEMHKFVIENRII